MRITTRVLFESMLFIMLFHAWCLMSGGTKRQCSRRGVLRAATILLSPSRSFQNEQKVLSCRSPGTPLARVCASPIRDSAVEMLSPLLTINDGLTTIAAYQIHSFVVGHTLDCPIPPHIAISRAPRCHYHIHLSLAALVARFTSK
jgi:hypothetical protein